MCSWSSSSAFLLLEHRTHTLEPVATPQATFSKLAST
jgi:hypothetical protein